MAFGLFQLLAGKLHFGIILGWVTMASMFLYVVFNMLAGRNGNLDMYKCLSLIGYCMLPIVMLSALSLFVPQGGMVIMVITGLFVIWSTRVCTGLVVELANCGDEHRGLITAGIDWHFIPNHNLFVDSSTSLSWDLHFGYGYITQAFSLVTEIGGYGNTDIAFSPYGEYWRQLRKICTSELLSPGRVKSFQPIREEEISALQEGSPINLTEKLDMTNNDIMARAALGKKSDEKDTLIAIFKEYVKLSSAFHMVDVYPSIKFFYHLISRSKRRIEKLHQQLDRIIGNFIEDRKRTNVVRIDKREKHDQDLLDVLLKVEGAGSLELPLTTDNIKSVLVDMFSAGTETSAIVVDWAMVEMLKNPTILNKAQYEVRQVFDDKRCVDESYFDELKYLKHVIKETLRLHPPTPFVLRESREPCTINGYEIPARTRVLVNIWAIGRDPEYWDDAESFKPERFLEKSVDFGGNRFEYIPFGAGKRICPGISFGLANVELQLAMFLYHFDWILPHGMKPEDLDMSELSGVAARRKQDLRVIPVVRRPLFAS
ncbi:hypothetical protein DH2020_030345 [Rehmannia glutinosa]|uniref:Yip1 domain-containing protein n=1 Tax=Rehmannia glutinosa TaxID=99300 RepID=A0ABR0VPK4_REHGL